MNKIGGLIALISGILQLVAGILGIVGVGHINFSTPINGLVGNIYFGVIIGFAVITILLGLGAMGKARGLSSFVLLIVFGANVVLLAINGWNNSAQLTSLIINAIGAGSIGIGMIVSKK